MWKRGGRSSALDRAQVLLSSQRSGGGAAGSVKGSAAKTPAHTGTVDGSAHILLSDLSDLSSVSSAPDPGGDTWGSPAAPPAGKGQEREGGSTNDLRPESSLGGGGSKFLKKAPPPATNSSQSPISKSQMQQVPGPRYVSSSQAAALSRLAQIENRIRSRKQAAQGPKPAENITPDLGVSPPTAVQSLEASLRLTAHSGSDQSLRGKRFLKNNNNAAAAAASSPQGPDVGVRSRFRAADAVVVSGVSLESDEDDMRKLLGDSLDSLDNNLIPGKLLSIRTTDKMLSKSNQRVYSTPPPAAVPPSSSSIAEPPHSPSSPSHRSSPFRFTGQAQAHFSPSVLSPSPSPPRDSPSPLGRLNFPHRAASPQRSLSSMSGRSEVLSLEELFPVGPGTEDAHSEMSAVSSEDFRINVMTLDDLVPAEPGFTEETPGKETEAKVSAPVSGSLNRQESLRVKEKEEGEEQQQQQQRQEDLPDYQSDFESESRTEPVDSASQVSEHLHGHGDDEEAVSEVREEASYSEVSRGRTEDDYSGSFSDTSHSHTSRTSDGSRALSRSRSSVSRGSQTFSPRASTRKVFKEAAVQTRPDSLAYTRPIGVTTLGPAADMDYINPTSVFAHTLSAEMVQALSSFNPAVFALNELLKQQLAMTRQFIESSRHLHSSLLRSLEPPNYRYTTLEDTKEYIRRRRTPKLTMEEALDEVQQEMRDYHLT